MKKKLIIIISIAVVVVLAALILIITLGGKDNNNTSSDIDINSSEIISAVDESSSNTESSSDETSSEECSSQTSTPSKTESSPKPTTSTNKTESKTETTSNTTTTPTTYFEKHNLKLSPLSTKMCFNTDKNHICGTNGADEKSITITVTSCVDANKDEFPRSILEEEKMDASKYKSVHLEHAMDFSCKIPRFPTYIFDKNTGIIISHSNAIRYYDDPDCCEGMEGWTEITINQRVQKIWSSSTGGGRYWWDWHCLCPKDYDGLVFVFMEDKNNCKERISDRKTHTIDEVIDFENDKYYLFAAN